MHGYDTVVAAFPLVEGAGDLPWQQVDEGRKLGGVRRLRALAPLERVQMTYAGLSVDDQLRYGEVRVQSSLPKMLWQTNTRELVQDEDFQKAVDGVSSAVSSFLDRKVDVMGWALRRIDVTGDVVLGDEGLVQASLERLARGRIRGQLPVVGQARSCTWPAKRGGLYRKAYSKYHEFLGGKDASLLAEREPLGAFEDAGPAATYSEALRSARGRLRVEVGCIGQKSMKRRGLGESGEVVTVDRLTGADGQAFRERVAGPFLARIREVTEVVEVDAWEAFQRFKAGGKRSNRAGALIGYVWVVQRLGWGYLEDMLSRQAIWQIKRDLREAGVDPLTVEFAGKPRYGLVEIAREQKRTPMGAHAERMADEEDELELEDGEELQEDEEDEDVDA